MLRLTLGVVQSVDLCGLCKYTSTTVVTYREEYEHTGNGNTLKKVISTFEMFPSHFGKSSGICKSAKNPRETLEEPLRNLLHTTEEPFLMMRP